MGKYARLPVGIKETGRHISMKPNFALDLSHDGIRLLHRAPGGWRLVGDVALDDPDMAEKLGQMRAFAETLDDAPLTTKLIVPNSQVLYTSVEASGPDDIAREVQIRSGLEGVTPYAVADLVFDWRADGNTARVAVIARETMDEAETFASSFGYNPVSFVARPDSGAFSGEPFFGKTTSAAQILGAAARVTPDTSPVPKSPKLIDQLLDGDDAGTVEPQASTPAAPHAETPTAPETTLEAPTPEPASPDEPVNEPIRPSLDDMFEDLRPSAPSEPVEPAEKPAKKPRSKSKRKSAETQSTPVLAPFPPTPDEASEAAATSQPRFLPVGRAEESAPGNSEPTSAPATTAPGEAPVGPPPSFSSRRSPSEESAEDATTASAPQTTPPVPQARPAVSASPSVVPQSAPKIASTGGPSGSSARKVVLDDTQFAKPVLTGDAEKRRAAMARALGHGTEEPAPSGPGIGERLSKATGSAVSALIAGAGKGASVLKTASANRQSKREAKSAEAAEIAEAAKSAATFDTPAPADDPAPAPARRGFLRKAPEPVDDARSKEAEALTVFGARKTQAEKRNSGRTGLVMTVGLVLLLAIGALWSSYFLEDDSTPVFNPDVADTPATDPTPDRPIVAEADPEPTPEPEPEPTPSADVLSSEEAEASYAATGVWQKAPNPLGDPDTALNEDVYVASIDPTVDPNDALALPEPGLLSGLEQASPTAPPPPGTTFNLDDDGLVVATPEGAVSPQGVLVTRGRPPVVPPQRPAGLAPAPEPQNDAALTLEPAPPGERPRERPENLTELAERGRFGGQTLAELGALKPRERPDDLQIAEATPQVDDAAVDEAVAAALDAPEASPEPQLENATELAVAASVRPSTKPRNFTQVVARAQEQARDAPSPDNSDGTQVIAASAATTRAAIPTTASVARSATMKNALNLSRINLIGVYGSSSSRRALVRLSSGRYVKVSVGDRLDGGRVTAISSTRLTYQKSGRQMTLDVLPLG